jgi:hypothetical protein
MALSKKLELVQVLMQKVQLCAELVRLSVHYLRRGGRVPELSDERRSQLRLSNFFIPTLPEEVPAVSH